MTDKNIFGRAPGASGEVMYLMLNSIPLKGLEEHYAWIKRTRRKFVPYGFNGRTVFVPRAMARDAARERIIARTPS